MKLSSDRLLWIGMAVLLGTGALAGSLGFIALQRLEDDRRDVTATHEVLGLVNGLMIELDAAESVFQNSARTGDEPFAESVRDRSVRIAGQVSRLKAMLKDDPPEFEDLAILERDVPARLSNIQEGTDLLPTLGAAATEALVLDGAGARMMDGIRAAASRITAREQEELIGRQAHADKGARNAMVTMFSATGMGTIMLAALAAWAAAGLAARRRAAAADALLSAIVNSSPDAVVTRDPFGNVVSWSPGAERLLGYAAEDVLGNPADLFVPQLEHDAIWARIAAQAPGTGAISAATVCLTRGGDPVELQVMGFAVGDGRLAAIMHDITAQERAAAAALETQARLQAILDNSMAVISVKDLEGRYVIVNRQFELTMGRSSPEIVGLTARDLFAEEEANLTRQRELRVTESGEPGEWEEALQLPMGNRTFLANGFPLFDASGNVNSFCGIYLDITDRKQAEMELVKAIAAAEAANREKSEFLSRMSHELRTPLNVILGFGQILRLDELSADQEEAVGHILGSGGHLLGLIDDVLDIARIESGRTQVVGRATDLGSVAQDVLQLVEPLAAQHLARIEVVRASEPGECWVIADRQRLSQVLLNLVANAIKYNHEGGSATIKIEGNVAGSTRLSVTDTGRGIPPAKLGRLFAPFERLGAETTDVQGTGLGLALSKRLAEAMGGSIGVESTVGVGSTFWVDLKPALPPQEHAEEATPGSPGQLPGSSPAEQTVLYVEDNLANVELVEHLLSRWPHTRLIPAMQGQMGIDLARQHRPDLIVLDLDLPDLPGEEVLRQLKAGPRTRDIPVIVASAYATPEHTQQLKAAGAIGYFTRPFDITKLLAAVGEVLGRTGSGSPAGRA